VNQFYSTLDRQTGTDPFFLKLSAFAGHDGSKEMLPSA